MTELEQQLTDHLRRRAAAATPRFDLEGIEQGSSLRSLVDLDDRSPRLPMARTIVAAAVALLALVGALALLDDGQTVDTVPVTTGVTEATTTEEPLMAAFGVPLRLDLPPGWTIVEIVGGLSEFALGPISGLPKTSIKLAIPDAATPEAVADIAAMAPSLVVLSDPVDTSVGNMPATCMDVASPDGEPGGTPLFQLRDVSESLTAVVLEEGAGGRVCVVDVEGDPVIVLVQAPIAEFEVFVEDAEVLLDGVEFDGGYIVDAEDSHDTEPG